MADPDNRFTVYTFDATGEQLSARHFADPDEALEAGARESAELRTSCVVGDFDAFDGIGRVYVNGKVVLTRVFEGRTDRTPAENLRTLFERIRGG